jgi:hypothetical protein
VHHVTLMNQHQLDTLFLVCLLGVNAFTCFGRFRIICSSSGGATRYTPPEDEQVMRNRNLHALNTHPTHAITPNSNCAEPPEDWRVTPET